MSEEVGRGLWGAARGQPPLFSRCGAVTVHWFVCWLVGWLVGWLVQEILQYLKDVAAKTGVEPFFRFGYKVREATVVPFVRVCWRWP